ncbi:hypothetical protein C8J45_101854 [Sphingomonas sp. PP-CE-3G-477]|uniref:hypothetical protein n=1 Tax=Sphingomonas sp. PP-CE-3G-477 TaxID=2135660 RepID=UPI000D4E859B|nr:hypothetical protein [Sphingomonas sp. PP-CE-3G-477]PTQ65989.1 hypothetical protein C8J45_101854 [Sphingomonas sp. PP-CE-3G-477]
MLHIALAGLALIYAPQDTVPSVPHPPVEPASDEIVVTALRDIEDKSSAVTLKSFGTSRTGSAVRSRQVFDLSQRWAACPARAAPDRRTWLQTAIDSRTNSTRQEFAMLRLAKVYAACAPDTEDAHLGIIQNVYYDRGALMVEALKAFVPDLVLTKEQTADPEVQARFNAREISLAKFRLPVDRRYFEAAVCFVRIEPELAVKLAMTDKPLSAVRRIEAAIVNRGRICVGNARNVYFDGTQFRFYIADAVYRWAVAAKGVDTLIPTR